MEQKNKQLLYYDSYQKMQKHYRGAPIYHFSFKDIRTGDKVTLGACYYSNEIANCLGEHYYEDITDAENDFDILWNLSDEKISGIKETFEEVQLEFQRMLKKGVYKEDINSTMLKYYKPKAKNK